MYSKETIAAISTGMSNSGIGIIRISGDNAFDVIDEIYRGNKKISEQPSHTIHYGYVVDNDETIDEVLVSIFKAPKTFTGENTIEINCHGGVLVTKKVLEVVLNHGARPAEPGEFTKRAFLNGKMDLSQSESVIDLIMAKNDYAMKSSISQLKGNLKKKISDIRNQIIYNTAFIESALDDPEHIDVDGYGKKLQTTIIEMIEELEKLILSSENGRIIKEGIQTVIVGKPNAGKSSLLNALSGKERAIVTDIAGTTRDVLEEQITLDGINLNIVDTAGIRTTEDIIEKIGVERAIQYAKDADLLIYVVDASKEIDENDEKIIKLILDRKVIILLNKIDLNIFITKEKIQKVIDDLSKTEKNESYPAKQIPIIEISAKKQEGIKEISERIKRMFFKGNLSFNDEIYITNLRQKTALKQAVSSLKKVLESIENQLPEDFYSIDLMDAYEILGKITGETIGEDLINEIFSKFCMGK